MNGNPGVMSPPPIPPRSNFPATTGSSMGYPSSHPMGSHPMSSHPMGGSSHPWATSMGLNSPYSSPYSSGFNSYSATNNFSSNNLMPSGARGPFETVESVVHAVSSISMLLEQTYSALISSVRSVYAVGEQVSRMKNQMGHLYAALAFTRLLRWFRDNFGWAFGRKPTPDLIWTNVADEYNSKKRPPQWPLLVYMAFLIGAPYITWKFVQSLSLSESEISQKWMEGDAEHFVAQADYEFDASRPDELSFKSGDRLKIAPTDLQTSGNRGWLLATVDGQKSGLVPVNRIKILGRKVPNQVANE